MSEYISEIVRQLRTGEAIDRTAIAATLERLSAGKEEAFQWADKFKARAEAAEARLHSAEDRIDKLETALEGIQQWSEAYPLDIFPEPDFKRARELLQAGGMTLDAVSASCMRHVIEGVGKIAREALAPPTD